jgi:hypothetical protein
VTTARLLTPPPIVRFDGDTGRRVLAETVGVCLGRHVLDLGQVGGVEHHTSGTRIYVPQGFEYDGASIPWFAEPVMGARELYEVAGLLHDALYRWQAPRGPSDYVFWLVARSGSRHVGPVRGWLGWAGLRVGGWVAYRRRG